jgi:hypothetical protein
MTPETGPGFAETTSSQGENPFYYEGCDPVDAQQVHAMSKILGAIDSRYGNGREVVYGNSINDADGKKLVTALNVVVGSYLDRHPSQQDILFPPTEYADRATQRIDYVRQKPNPVMWSRTIVQSYKVTKEVLEALN